MSNHNKYSWNYKIFFYINIIYIKYLMNTFKTNHFFL